MSENPDTQEPCEHVWQNHGPDHCQCVKCEAVINIIESTREDEQ